MPDYRTNASRPTVMNCRRIADDMLAFGHAANLLRRAQPFASYPFGNFAGVLMGQIRRKHYVFTVADKRVVGYAGWAMCREDVARDWVDRNIMPDFDACNRGDCLVVATFYGESRDVTFMQARHVRESHPNVKVYGRRDYSDRMRPTNVFNRVVHAGGALFEQTVPAQAGVPSRWALPAERGILRGLTPGSR